MASWLEGQRKMSEMIILIYIIQHQFTTCQLSTGTEEAMLDEKWLPQCCECFSVVPFVSLCWSSNTKNKNPFFSKQTQHIQILNSDYYLRNSGYNIVHLRCRQVAIPGQCHLRWGIITAMKLHRFTYYSETTYEDSLQHVIFISVGQDPTQQTNAIYSYFIAWQ